MKLSIAIMSVPQRAEHVRTMVGRLGQQISAARATGLDVVGTHVFVDSDRRGPWYSWRGAWETHRPLGSTHHVVLQDDVLFCADLPATLWRMAEARPGEVISGFLPRKSVDTAVAKARRWVRTRRFLWAQCVMMPTQLGDEALRWIDAREETEAAAEWREHDDVRLAAFLTARRLHVFVPVPHPVEHIGDELGSVMGHNFTPAKRRARAWLGEEARGAHLEWTDLRHVQE